MRSLAARGDGLTGPVGNDPVAHGKSEGIQLEDKELLLVSTGPISTRRRPWPTR